ncbi:MAG: hypothetical protein KJO07_21925, partial [Deltaproteobacteria bacterium]|nr:hypothetical protein [Deltaproteobacteria bacterium]
MKRSLVVVVLSLACGSSSSLGPIPPVDVSKPSFANSSITAEHLRTYVELLASDDYGGRGTLEEGEAKAAAYLASQFDSFGLVPLPGQGSYRVGAELERTGFEVERTHGTIIVGDTKKVITGGVHFKPFGFSASGEVKAEAVFAGYGISRPDLGYDDYEGLDVSGKIVFVLRHAPKKDKSDKRFERGRDSFFVTKAEVARKKG